MEGGVAPRAPPPLFSYDTSVPRDVAFLLWHEWDGGSKETGLRMGIRLGAWRGVCSGSMWVLMWVPYRRKCFLLLGAPYKRTVHCWTRGD